MAEVRGGTTEAWGKKGVGKDGCQWVIWFTPLIYPNVIDYPTLWALATGFIGRRIIDRGAIQVH